MTLFEQLTAATRRQPKAGEDFQEFATDAVKRINKFTDAEWDALTDPLQRWVNAAQKAREASEEIPALEGYPAAETGEAVEGEEAAEIEGTGEAEATEEEATEEKETKVKRVKPEKVEKPVKVAKPKKEKVVKATKRAKANGQHKGRPPSYAPDAKIKLLVKENPHRSGTGRFKRWGKFKDGMTVAEAVKAGFNSGNLRHSVLDGHIKISG